MPTEEYIDEHLFAEKLSATILKIREELPNIAIPSGSYSISDGLKLVPIAITAQAIKNLEHLVQMKAMRDAQDKQEDKMWTYVIMLCAIMGTIGMSAVIMKVTGVF